MLVRSPLRVGWVDARVTQPFFVLTILSISTILMRSLHR